MRHDRFTLFKSHGKINSSYLVREKITKQPKGTAFVYFHNPCASRTALTVGSDDAPPPDWFIGTTDLRVISRLVGTGDRALFLLLDDYVRGSSPSGSTEFLSQRC